MPVQPFGWMTSKMLKNSDKADDGRRTVEMKVEDMETVDQREVDRKVRNYRLQKYLGGVGFVIVAIHLFYVLFSVTSMFWMTGYLQVTADICVMVAHFVALVVLAFVVRTANLWIYGCLQNQCDPFLFEACLYHLGAWGGENTKRLNLAVAQYYQGNFEQASDTLQHVNPESFKKTNRLNYYIIRCSLCFRMGMPEKVRELENEFQRQISGKEDARNMRILCAMNNMKRACQNQDYPAAWRFYYEWLGLTKKGASQEWSLVGRIFQTALLEKECGNETRAREGFAYVKKHGNRLMFAEEAGRFLGKKEQDDTQIKENGGEESDGRKDPGESIC